MINQIQIGRKVENKEVIGITYIQHGELFPNTQIKAKFIAKSSTGKIYEGEIYGTNYRLNRTASQITWCKEGEWVYNGDTGEFEELIYRIKHDR